jgi:hypothetical protein
MSTTTDNLPSSTTTTIITQEQLIQSLRSKIEELESKLTATNKVNQQIDQSTTSNQQVSLKQKLDFSPLLYLILFSN